MGLSNSEKNEDLGPSLTPEVERIVENFQTRTLDEMPGQFRRLIYLASLRDYNTGRYHHYGLESRYPSDAVDRALRRCHRLVFEELMDVPLRDATEDLMEFFESLQEDRARLVEAWERLRSYQMLPPENCVPMERELFEKNVALILQVLRSTELWDLLRNPHGDTDDLT